MCGIVGLISKPQNGFPYYATELFTQMLIYDSIRGEDSTGVFGVSQNNQYDLVKGNSDGYMFTKSANYKKFKDRIYCNYRFLIGHNRKATKGTVNPNNAHPFVEKNIILVHNGTIHNAAALNKEVEVDSHAIAHALSENDAESALGKINGAYALVWYDTTKKTLNLARNKERPLHIIDYPDLWVISSEIGLPLWLQGRDNRQSKKIETVPVGIILQMHLDERDKPFETVKYEEYKTKTHGSSIWPKAGITEEAKTTNFLPSRKPEVPVVYNVKKINQTANLKLQSGTMVKFKVDEIKNDETNGAALLGHPLIDNDTADGNILIRAFVPRPVDMAYYQTTRIWEGRVVNVRPIHHMLTAYVRDIKPIYSFEDAAGNKFNESDLPDWNDLLCGICQNKMYRTDISKSILRKREDGSWKLMCKDCLTHAVDHAALTSEASATLYVQ